MIVAGFSSRSLFGEIGSAREAVLLVSYNLVFLLAAVSIAVSQHSFRLDALAGAPATPWRYLGLIAILVCLPAKLHVNPFSLPNAEQEIYSGPMVEYAGFELALWQLSHGLEWIAGVGRLPHLPSRHPLISGWMWWELLVSDSFLSWLYRLPPQQQLASPSTQRFASIGSALSSSRSLLFQRHCS